MKRKRFNVSAVLEQLKADTVAAMKSGDKQRVSVLRMVVGVVQTAEKSGKTAVVFTDEQVLEVLAREAKKRLDTAEEYRKVGVEDRAILEEQEAEIIREYLPAVLDVAETEVVVNTVFALFESPTAKDMGSIMKAVKEAASGMNVMVDNKLVSDIVRARLS